MSLGPRKVCPDLARVKLGFSENVSLDLSSTGYAEHTFRLNSLFDPDFTGTGSQPIGFDQWSAFYNRYRVHNTKFKVMAISTATTLGFIMGCNVRRESAVSPIYIDNIGEPFNQWTMGGSAQAGPVKIEGSNSIKEVYGIDNRTFMDEDYSASISGSPSRVNYLHVWANTWDVASAALVIQVFIELTFETDFYERVDLDDSFASVVKKSLLPTPVKDAVPKEGLGCKETVTYDDFLRWKNTSRPNSN